MKTHKAAVPFKWPFRAAPRGAAPAPRDAKPASLPGAPTRKSMLADVVMVMFWGASIPGLMWLGAAGGF